MATQKSLEMWAVRLDSQQVGKESPAPSVLMLCDVQAALMIPECLGWARLTPRHALSGAGDTREGAYLHLRLSGAGTLHLPWTRPPLGLCKLHRSACVAVTFKGAMSSSSLLAGMATLARRRQSPEPGLSRKPGGLPQLRQELGGSGLPLQRPSAPPHAAMVPRHAPGSSHAAANDLQPLGILKPGI